MPPSIIDLRSDTFTLPTSEMREAMSKAKLGDDVVREDPTVNELEQLAAKMLGKEAALFVASGTMGNLVALLTHCGRGDEVILGRLSHIHIHEAGGISALGSIHPRTVNNLGDGTMELAAIEDAINQPDVHHADTRLICVENTWMGRALPIHYMKSVRDLAKSRGIKVHLDGARLFNAAIALKASAADIAKHADTIQFCLSKGLASPVGSLLVGPREFIERARRNRKMLGGGMRQAGVLAACGLVSLTKMVDRLQDDHTNAELLANELRLCDDLEISGPHTNMVFIKSRIKTMPNADLRERMQEYGVLAFEEPLGIRLVTHHGIEKSDAAEACTRILQICARATRRVAAKK
jgi:threonine aldolase